MLRRKDWFLKLDWQGATDLQQAQFLVRSLFTFAERDVRRAYIYFFNDDDSPSVHGSAGLTRKFVPKPSFWAIKQLDELLGNCRFDRVVKKVPARCSCLNLNRARALAVSYGRPGRRPERARTKRTITPPVKHEWRSLTCPPR